MMGSGQDGGTSEGLLTVIHTLPGVAKTLRTALGRSISVPQLLQYLERLLQKDMPTLFLRVGEIWTEHG